MPQSNSQQRRNDLQYLGVRWREADADDKHMIAERIATIMIPEIELECRIGKLQGKSRGLHRYGVDECISALGMCLDYALSRWDSSKGELKTWLVLLIEQQASKWAQRQDKDTDPRSAMSQAVRLDEYGEEIDPFDSIASKDEDPYFIDDMLEELGRPDDDMAMLLQAYVLCFKEGVPCKISQLSVRSGLSYQEISKLVADPELTRRIRAISW